MTESLLQTCSQTELDSTDLSGKQNTTNNGSPLEELIRKLKDDLNACDMKWTLFVAAAQSYRYDSQLKPSPAFYQMGTTVDITKLMAVIEIVPPLETLLGSLLKMKNSTDDALYLTNEKIIQLLHWVLVTVFEPLLKSVDRQNIDSVLAKVVSVEPGPRPSHIFEVVSSSRSVVEKKFQEHALNGATAFAYHGSKIFSFHSIMNYGLQQHLCKTALFGEGIYLSSEMHVSLNFSPAGTGWANSRFGKEIACLAMCEFVHHPEHLKCHTKEHKSPIRKTSSEVPDKYFVITNNEIVRLRYLVVYGRDERITKKLSQPTHRNPIINWIMSNKAVTVMCFYAVLLLAVGVGNSGYFTYFRQVVWRRAMIFLQDIKNTYFNEFSLMSYF